MEVCFFPVPNIDEVTFGTPTNKAFGTEVAVDLGMGEYKPGSTIRTYLVQYSNVYWAKKVRYILLVKYKRYDLATFEMLSKINTTVCRIHRVLRAPK